MGTNNSSQAYSGAISGGAAGGNGSLIKVGTGTKTLTGGSTFSGGVTINGGVFSANSLSTGGTNSSGIGEGPANASGQSITFNGGMLNYTGGNTGTAGKAANSLMFNPNITLNSSGGTMNLAELGDGKYIGFAGRSRVRGTLLLLTPPTRPARWQPGLLPERFASSTLFAGFTGNIIIGQGGNIQIRNSTVTSLGSGTVDINCGGILSSDKGNAYSTGITNPIVLTGGSLATQGRR